MNVKDILIVIVIVFGTTMLTIGLQHWIPESVSPTLACVIGFVLVATGMYMNSIDD